MNIFTHKIIIQPKDNINVIFHQDDNITLSFGVNWLDKNISVNFWFQHLVEWWHCCYHLWDDKVHLVLSSGWMITLSLGKKHVFYIKTSSSIFYSRETVSFKLAACCSVSEPCADLRAALFAAQGAGCTHHPLQVVASWKYDNFVHLARYLRIY